MNKINPYPITSTKKEIIDNNKIIQNIHFKNNINKEELKIEDNSKIKKGSDKIKCMICSKYFTRYNKSKHNKTSHHIFCEKMNKKWRNMIIN